ncbi:MAG: LuxR family transcriptional regulator [Variovorax sp.]|nr:LuxR family transcriptional regulator [Variovorax sp.]
MTGAEPDSRRNAVCQQLNRASDSTEIYVIDDHPIMRDAIASVLRRLRGDARILEIGTLAEVPLATSTDAPPLAIVLDLNLPDAEGCSGVMYVRSNYPQTPLAVCSASPAVEVETKCIAAGANLYIDKAAGSQHLKAAMQTLLSMGADDAGGVERAALGLSKNLGANA